MRDYFTPKGSNTTLKINSVKKFIAKSKSKNINMDISSLNPIEASKIAVLCSTNQYLKNPKGIINCIVNSTKIIDLIRPLSLGNMRFQTK